MKPSLLDMMRRAQDRTVGQTLIRLAHLAAAAHRYEQASQMQGDLSREDQRGVEGLDPWPAVRDAASGKTHIASTGESVHTEVDR